ncbi:MAG: hypothetical protein VYE51_03610, partial [Candidatus Thermoplasmatota archaeon]|nr:hypothetical protein [Candidatus Thermoplasmatota archaeon]
RCARPAYINDSPKIEASDPQNDDGEVDVSTWMWSMRWSSCYILFSDFQWQYGYTDNGKL